MSTVYLIVHFESFSNSAAASFAAASTKSLSSSRAEISMSFSINVNKACTNQAARVSF